MDALGINIQSLLIYLALFGIVYSIISKALLPALLKSIDERSILIAQVRKDKERIGIDKTAAEDQVKQLEKETLVKATEKANTVVDEADKEAVIIIKKANETAKSVVSDAQAAIEKKKESLQAKFDEEVTALVGSVLSEMPEIAKKYSTKEIAQLIASKKHG
jgi:F0F1-type ATP synthase membrane subunit b/b'